VHAVRTWRAEPEGAEPRLSRDELEAAIRRRRSIRRFSPEPLPRNKLAELLAWAEAPIPADAPRMVRQLLTVAAVEGLPAGVYDTGLQLLSEHDENELRRRAGIAAMEQEHSEQAAVNVIQVAGLDAVIARLGERGYRWAQLESGIRAGRLQIGAFTHGWGATATTFYDDDVPRLLETDEAPMLMVALGRRA
jgi:nitroreductase